MRKEITVSYLNRESRKYSRDLSVPKITLANKLLLQNGFSVGVRAEVFYMLNQIIINKI
jgi:hypothetical protein